MYFWIVSLFILVFGYISLNDNSALDFNVHDTYYVVAQKEWTHLLAILIFIPGIIYWLFDFLKLKLRIKLTIVHTCITVISILSYPLVELYFKKNSKEFPLFDASSNFNSFITFLIILVFVTQLIFIFNIIISLVKRYYRGS